MNLQPAAFKAESQLTQEVFETSSLGYVQMFTQPKQAACFKPHEHRSGVDYAYVHQCWDPDLSNLGLEERQVGSEVVGSRLAGPGGEGGCGRIICRGFGESTDSCPGGRESGG